MPQFAPTPSVQSPTAWQRLKLAVANGANLVGFVYATGYSAGTIGKWLEDLALAAGSTFIGYIQSGVGAVLRTLRERLREHVSVLDFGALPTNTAAQNQTAFAAALAAYSVVTVPRGTFLLTGSLNIKNKSLIGLSREESILQLVGSNTNDSLLVNGGDGTTAWGSGGGCSVRNLTLTGNWDGATANAVTDINLIGALVKWWGGAYVQIENCNIVSSYGFGVFCYRLGYSTIRRCHIAPTAKNGVHWEGVNGADAITSSSIVRTSINSCRGTGATGGSAIALTNVFQVLVDDCVLEDVENGVRVDGIDNRTPTIKNTHIESATVACINYVGAGQNMVLLANIFASLPTILQSNPAAQRYVSVGNFQMGDQYALPCLDSGVTTVNITNAAPKGTIAQLALTPGTWHITGNWVGTTVSGVGQVSSRQEYAINTAQAIPAYSAGFRAATVRGDCASTVNTADGIMQGSLGLRVKLTANTTYYLYGGAASISTTLVGIIAGRLEATMVNDGYAY